MGRQAALKPLLSDFSDQGEKNGRRDFFFGARLTYEHTASPTTRSVFFA